MKDPQWLLSVEGTQRSGEERAAEKAELSEQSYDLGIALRASQAPGKQVLSSAASHGGGKSAP